MIDALVSQCFQPIVGLPCWNAQRGYGSFITMEFGEPSLRIHESRRRSTRLVIPVGTWHLWIYMCAWQIRKGGDELAHSESPDDEIARAIAFLDGQKLDRLPAWNSVQKAWRFDFDLRGSLFTRSVDGYETGSNQWMLYTDRYVFSSDQLGRLHQHFK